MFSRCLVLNLHYIMSLFPAYSSKDNLNQPTVSTAEDLPNITDDNKETWLSNASFKSEVSFAKPIVDLSSSEDESIKAPFLPEEKRVTENSATVLSNLNTVKTLKSAKHPKKKKKKHKVKAEEKYERQVENVYFEDKILDERMSTVPTLCSRVRPLYNLSEKSLGFIPVKRFKKQALRRYYAKNIDKDEKSKKKDTVIKKTKSEEKSEIMPDWCVNIEEEQTSVTKDFNRKLDDNPHDIEVWLRFVDFQDNFVIFQPLKNNAHSILQKKLSIVEKALEKNPDSLELQKLKLFLISELIPVDQFSNELETLLNKDSGNLIVWQALIMATQSSVALCTTPVVLSLFTRCLFVLRQRSRTNPRFYDNQVLRTMFQCLMFLRHAGFWEQMWETIRMNLCLNLDLRKENLRLQSSIDEKNLIGLEEVILTSRLPLNQLWLRVESLRERCHWVSVTSDQLELIGDSKRFVLPEDVADFVHPLISNNSNFYLAVYSLLSLKVPLLPTRDNTLKDLGLKDLNWTFDSSEVLLPLSYPCVGEIAGYEKRKTLLGGLIEGQLTSGPQFLRFHPAQEPYLDFIRSAFRIIADALPASQRASIYIWWLRFERMLVYFGKDDPLKGDNRGKKLKTILKEFLKKSENRNNLHFYREYALIEYEQGRFENSVSILETALHSSNVCPATISDVEEKSAVMSIYRTLFEILLNTKTFRESNKDRIKKIAQMLAPETERDRLVAAVKFLDDFVEEFLSQEASDESEDAFFLPNVVCDTITCYAYLSLILDRNISEILNIFKKCIEHCEEAPRLQERLYESELVLLQFHAENIHNSKCVFKDVLNDALHLYPDNFYILSVFADIEYELPTWRQKKIDNIRLWQAITMCLAEKSRINHLKRTNLEDTARALLNKLLSFYRKLSQNPDIRHCPLLWRLFMLLLREENLCEKKGEDAYHESVTHCPWARSIYIDSSEIAPQQLTQIQDVIQGKELRIHVTPEELDILRS